MYEISRVFDRSHFLRDEVIGPNDIIKEFVVIVVVEEVIDVAASQLLRRIGNPRLEADRRHVGSQGLGVIHGHRRCRLKDALGMGYE